MKNILKAFAILLAGMISGVFLNTYARIPPGYVLESFVSMFKLYFVFFAPVTFTTSIILGLYLSSKEDS